MNGRKLHSKLKKNKPKTRAKSKLTISFIIPEEYWDTHFRCHMCGQEFHYYSRRPWRRDNKHFCRLRCILAYMA